MSQKKRISSRTLMLAALAVAVSVPMGASSAAAKDKNLLLLNCFSVSMQQGRTGMLEIGVERWSTDAEAEELKTVLVEKNEDHLLKALQKIKPRAGWARFEMGGAAWDVQFARQFPLPGGGRALFFATDRHIGFREAVNNGRSMDYEFTLAEIHLDKEGGKEGQGKLVGAAKVTYDQKKKTIQIENWGQEPVRLSQVKVVEDNE